MQKCVAPPGAQDETLVCNKPPISPKTEASFFQTSFMSYTFKASHLSFTLQSAPWWPSMIPNMQIVLQGEVSKFKRDMCSDQEMEEPAP